MKMLAARFYAPLDVRLEEIEVPRPGPGEVLVQVGAATTCGTDLKAYRRGHPVMLKNLPSLFGHEVAGTIAEVGTEVAGWHPGTRVVVANSAPCNRCFFCRRGQHSLCEDLLILNGAYADYLLVPARIVEQNLWELPAGVPFSRAALTEPLACALHGVEASNIHPGESVVIIGAGPLGLLLLAVARLKGARVIMCGRSAEKLAAARALGADEIIDMAQMPEHANQIAAARALTEGQRGADVVIEAVGVPEIWETAVRMVRRGGLVNFFGGCASSTTITLETQPLHYGEITIKGVFHHTPAYFSTALGLIASGRVPVEQLITDTLPLRQLPEAFRRLLAHQGIKYALLPEGSGAPGV
ncbi:MAG TPA: zinc-binding dehydrogenase [Ktedonobacterales bacterium]|jgi:L-iditol 2-dehydrogenase